MKKKFTKLAIVCGLTVMLSVNTFAALQAKDVASGHWAYEGIEYMVEERYMMMNSAGEFKPNETVSYFDFAEILAKVTGYQDELIVKDMDEAFKQEIRQNYTKQISKIQKYDNASKYTTWKSSANEEIAYLLGRGYLTENDLSKFMTKAANGKEVMNVMTKQDLSVFLVRLIGKQTTAEQNYKTTGYTDESIIKEANRPHVAYLKSVGILGTSPAMGANDSVTRALCAHMTQKSIAHKKELENQNVRKVAGKVYNIVDRNNQAGETLVLVEIEGKNKFYTANKSTKIIDENGKALKMDDIELGQVITLTLEEKQDNIIMIQLGQAIAPETGNPGIDTPENLPEVVDTYKGVVDFIGRNGNMSIYTDGGSVTFDVAKECDITYQGEKLNIDDVKLKDEVTITVKDEKITKIIITKRETVEKKASQFVKLINKKDKYYFTVLEGEKEKEMIIDKDVTFFRDSKIIGADEIRIGDKLTFTMQNNEVTEVDVVTTQSKATGKVKKVIIAEIPEIVIETKTGEMISFAITKDTEIYDSNKREDVTIRSVLLGMEVEIKAESKEAVSVVIEKSPTQVTYKGIIQEVGQGARSIDVLVEYDTVTGESMVIKRINVPVETIIKSGNKEIHRMQLEEDMEVLVKFAYSEDLYPTTIEVLK
ncbi:MAG: S-layer homology domain-containing protein [Cellulosilyticaceae bacterium]